MEKLTKLQEERIEKFWDINKIDGLLTSNVPRYLIEYNLFLAISIENEMEFLKKSKDLGILKKFYNAFNLK